VELDSDFRGKEALAGVAASPSKRLKAVRLGGDEVPEYGAAVTRGGEPVGTLTSPTNSPRFGVIGIAVLDAGAAAAGERVDVAVGEWTVPASVEANAAVYDPEKRRPRS
jgi:aminomethyltransferase